MIGVGKTAMAAGSRAVKATGRGLWRGTKILGGAAAIWALGKGGKNEIQLGNPDSYGNASDASTGTSSGAGGGYNGAPVVTELPGLKTPDQPERISSPTVATLIQSVDRLTGVATGIADNLLNLQNILVGQIEQSSDAAREAMLESGPQGMITGSTSESGDAASIENALEGLGDAVNPPTGLIETLIAGALSTWGLASTIKAFFSKSAAVKAAESRAAAAAASRSSAEAATQTARATQITGKFTKAARIGGRAMMGAGAALSAAESYSDFQRNRPGLGTFNAGAAALSGAELAASFGATAIAVPLAAAGAAAATLSIPFAVGELTSDEKTSRLMALEQRGLRMRVQNVDVDGALGTNTAAYVDSVQLAGVNIPPKRMPQPLQDIIDFYLGDRGAGAQRVDKDREKYAQYLDAVIQAGSLAEVVRASRIIDPEKGDAEAVAALTGNKGRYVGDIKWQERDVLEANVGEALAANSGMTGKDARDLSRKINEANRSSVQKSTENPTTTATAIGAERQVTPAETVLGPQTFTAEAPKGERAAPSRVGRYEAFARNPNQTPLKPIKPENVKPENFEFENKKNTLGRSGEFVLPSATRMPTFDGQRIDLGQVPNPSFVGTAAYSAEIFAGQR